MAANAPVGALSRRAPAGAGDLLGAPAKSSAGPRGPGRANSRAGPQGEPAGDGLGRGVASQSSLGSPKAASVRSALLGDQLGRGASSQARAMALFGGPQAAGDEVPPDLVAPPVAQELLASLGTLQPHQLQKVWEVAELLAGFFRDADLDGDGLASEEDLSRVVMPNRGPLTRGDLDAAVLERLGDIGNPRHLRARARGLDYAQFADCFVHAATQVDQDALSRGFNPFPDRPIPKAALHARRGAVAVHVSRAISSATSPPLAARGSLRPSAPGTQTGSVALPEEPPDLLRSEPGTRGPILPLGKLFADLGRRVAAGGSAASSPIPSKGHSPRQPSPRAASSAASSPRAASSTKSRSPSSSSPFFGLRGSPPAASWRPPKGGSGMPPAREEVSFRLADVFEASV